MHRTSGKFVIELTAMEMGGLRGQSLKRLLGWIAGPAEQTTGLACLTRTRTARTAPIGVTSDFNS